MHSDTFLKVLWSALRSLGLVLPYFDQKGSRNSPADRAHTHASSDGCSHPSRGLFGNTQGNCIGRYHRPGTVHGPQKPINGKFQLVFWSIIMNRRVWLSRPFHFKLPPFSHAPAKCEADLTLRSAAKVSAPELINLIFS